MTDKLNRFGQGAASLDPYNPYNEQHFDLPHDYLVELVRGIPAVMETDMYTADGLMDIVAGPRCKPKPMTYATRCKYLTKIGSICRLTRQMPVVVCMGICEDYEPVDSGGGEIGNITDG